MANRLGEIFYLLLHGRIEDMYEMLRFSTLYASGWDDVDLSELEENVEIGHQFCEMRKEQLELLG